MATTPSTIEVTRRPGWPWFRFQAFLIEMDGSIVGKIRGGQTRLVQVAAGEHRIRVRFRLVVWSDVVIVTLKQEETARLTCDTDWRGYPTLWNEN